MWTTSFWKQAIERALKTGAQTAVALFGATGLGVLDVDWTSVASVTALAIVASILTSIGTSQVGETDSPSAITTSASTPPSTAAPVTEAPRRAADDAPDWG